jgi:hypothetical protein
MIARAFHAMPLDLIAAKLGTNRDNVYKILDGAQKKLKGARTKRSLMLEEILQVFAKRPSW